ncbi:EcsC family protein [Jeotgalibacillus aurantiacus]|uniref:EcsC family protein n=1 Tax=Jeotgalibacillus aurantiacus TaxID=2763266 RepID=UPI001D0AAC05|nr:EcsC family protein [Jeotgalibacillus aurantiacus]
MSWTDREKDVYEEILSWREGLTPIHGNDLSYIFAKWLERSFSALPEELKKELFSKIDTSLFHMHSTLQGFQLTQDERERMMKTARAFDDTIQQLEDFQQLSIDQLNYLSLQQTGKHRLYSFVQGGIAGTGGTVAFLTDLIAMLLLNIRAIQMIATSYGRDIHTPYEMTLALKVFHAATLPKRFQRKAWDDLIQTADSKKMDYFFTENDELINEKWLEGPGLQLIKTFAIRSFQDKKISNIPVISVSIGAVSNYQLTRKITEFAEHFYQYRFLMDKKDD